MNKPELLLPAKFKFIAEGKTPARLLRESRKEYEEERNKVTVANPPKSGKFWRTVGEIDIDEIIPVQCFNCYDLQVAESCINDTCPYNENSHR